MLSTVVTLALPPDGLVLQAQRRIDALISGMVQPVDEESSHVPPRQLSEELDNIYTAGSAAISALVTTVPLAAAGGQALTELGNPSFSTDKGSARYTRHGPRRDDASAIAFCAAVAVAMLREGAARPDQAITRWLADSSVAYAAKVLQAEGPAAILRLWRRATPDLQGAVLKSLGPQLTGSRRLRYCTSTTTPGQPAEGIGKARASAVPALLWPSWALRLNPGFDSLPYRQALSVMVLHAASRNDYTEARAHLGHKITTGRPASHFMRRLKEAGALDAVLSALGQLARKLDELGAPIDYARRRALFTPASLDRGAWQRYCDRIGHPLWGGQERIAALRLAELLTGNHPRYYSPPFGLNGNQGYKYANLVLKFPAELTGHLQDQASRLLAVAKISEPIRWEPPFEWVEGVCWPGPELQAVPAEEIRELLQRGLTPRALSRQFSTSIEHIRLAAEICPAPLPSRPLRPRPNMKIPRSSLPGFAELSDYYAAGLGRRPIARLAGCSQTTAAALLKEAGLPPRLPGYRTSHITAEWVAERYVRQQLTLREIADEAGVSPAAVSRLAHQYGIKVRRGGAAHRNVLARIGKREDYPPEIWAAFGRSGGEQRIRRAIVVMTCPSFPDAGRKLRVSNSVISAQIAGLERDLGIRLMIRSSVTRNTVTPQGREFARQARRILKQLDQLPPCRSGARR